MKKIVFLILVSVGAILLLISQNVKTTVAIPESDKIVIYKKQHLIKTVQDTDLTSFHALLTKTKPYLFTNEGAHDNPLVSSYYTLKLFNKGAEVGTLYLYSDNNNTILEKPYEYTVKLQEPLENLIELN
ncbi:DUF5301 domain-containing protein [Streptococcus suis]